MSVWTLAGTVPSICIGIAAGLWLARRISIALRIALAFMCVALFAMLPLFSECLFQLLALAAWSSADVNAIRMIAGGSIFGLQAGLIFSFANRWRMTSNNSLKADGPDGPPL